MWAVVQWKRRDCSRERDHRLKSCERQQCVGHSNACSITSTLKQVHHSNSFLFFLFFFLVFFTVCIKCRWSEWPNQCIHYLHPHYFADDLHILSSVCNQCHADDSVHTQPGTDVAARCIRPSEFWWSFSILGRFRVRAWSGFISGFCVDVFCFVTCLRMLQNGGVTCLLATPTEMCRE